MRIAQRFNAGWCGAKPSSPEGTKENAIWKLAFCRPSGTGRRFRLNPALNLEKAVEPRMNTDGHR